MWSFPVRQSVNVNGVAYDKPSNPFRVENDSIIVSTDANPSPGLSRVRTKHRIYGPFLLIASYSDCCTLSER
jgi:hypothetical protein